MIDSIELRCYVFFYMKSDTSLLTLKEQVLSALTQHSMLTMLFDNLPGITFFVKSLDSILLSGSRSFYERLGYTKEEQMLGKTDFDFFPIHMAEHFRADDKEVMLSKCPKVQIVELFFNRHGIPDWYITNKFPILDVNGQAIGLMGTTQSYTGAKENITPYLLIDKAVEIIRSSFREKSTSLILPKLLGCLSANFSAVSIKPSPVAHKRSSSKLA
jgi:PAS domain-containing protein